MMNNLVVTLIGPDRPGLVEAVAQTVAEHGGNWLESRMAHLAGKFAGILRVEAPATRAEALLVALTALESAGLKIVAEHGPSASSVANEGRVFELELVGLDRPGIVREISQLFSESGANVEELITDRVSAPMSGEMLFQAKARVNIPTKVDLGALRKNLSRLANDLLVEIRLLETALETKLQRP